MKQGVNEMRIVDLRIEDVAFGGKGVGRESGKAVFIPYTIEGETVSAEILREKKQFADANLVEVKQSSPDRVKPQCPYFGRCGGCAYQHISYEDQLAIKWRQVRDALQRIGKLKDILIRPIIPSPKQYGFRKSITIHAQDGVIGFDWDRFADAVARENATEKETYISGDVETELQQVRAVDPNRTSRANDVQSGGLRSMPATTLVVDPPATGLSEPVRKTIVDL